MSAYIRINDLPGEGSKKQTGDKGDAMANKKLYPCPAFLLFLQLMNYIDQQQAKKE
ncbi:MAG: hypothetical protein HFI11_00600 [Lachnospiraceae bacterium]|jgi:hypothetical protein|nr:hypothetical protein [Lachnospiraceae bacterium]